MLSSSSEKYDCIIIGAGFSGLAAAVRLAHFNKKVCVCEQHYRLGGLNSWYKINGFEIDSGLHAMTNFTAREGHKSLPLKKLLRQLRIPYDALELREQKQSAVVFPQGRLDFSNNFEMLKESVS
jgi:phytoene dehydrogenase-like protein